jgi:hypothetical protein
MGKKAWTTARQCTWLKGQTPDFVQAQYSKVVGLFLKDVYGKWEDEWPTPPLTEKDVKHTKGNTEKALAIKQKKIEDIRTHNKKQFHTDTSTWTSSV